MKIILFTDRKRPPLHWRGVRGEAKTGFVKEQDGNISPALPITPLSPIWQNRLWDIRFYIALFFLLRLWGITNPPVDGNHGWRQSQTCMVARNLVEVENNPFYPRADQFGGDKTGIFGSEFPFFQELIAGISAIFGYEHWYGRLINLIVTSFGIYFFYLFLLMWTPQRMAFYSALLLLLSLWFMFGRKIMPDTFSVSITIAGVYFASLYAKAQKWYHLIWVFLLFALGGLSKLPAAFVFILIPFITFTSSSSVLKKLSLLAVTGMASILILWWYFIWNPHLVETYGSNIMFVKTFGEGLYELSLKPGPLLEKFYFACTQSYLATVICLGGLIWILVKEKGLRWPIMAVLGMLLLFMIKVGGVFGVHNYYMIPFAPLYAMGGGYLLSQVKIQKISIALLLILAVESLTHQIGDLSYPHKRAYKLELETTVDSLLKKGETVTFVSDDNPLEMYCAHRKGWLIWPEQVVSENKLNYLESAGCKLIIVNKINYGEVKPPRSLVFENEYFRFYSLP